MPYMYACRSFRLLISMFIVYMNVSLRAREESSEWRIWLVREKAISEENLASVCVRYMRPKSFHVY